MRIIDADVLKKLVAGWVCFIREDCDTLWTGGIEEAIDNLPTVEERKTGKWIHDGYDFPHGNDWIHCSVCGKRGINVPADRSNYCPNCGAKMEES